MNETLVVLDGVGKRFSRAAKHPHKDLARDLWSLFWGLSSREDKADPERFWAVHGVSFDVQRGEVLGIIGHNGAGKTTLLRLLNGEMDPDAGSILVRGNRSSLIDLTGGFSMTLTGRENIYYRGAHLGFERAFLKAREQDIIDFAELGEFIDAPIKTYSSGMLMRLGFAVTVFAEPDVLLIDEILSVGDFLFAQKCMNKLNHLKANAAVVMVSHSMSAITSFADRVLLLDRGEPALIASPSEAVQAYHSLEESKQLAGGRIGRRTEPSLRAPGSGARSWPDFGTKSSKPATASSPAKAAVATAATPSTLDPGDLPPLVRGAMNNFLHNSEAISEARLDWFSERGQPINTFSGGAGALGRVSFTNRRHIGRLVVGVPLWSAVGALVTGFGMHGRFIIENLPPGRHAFLLHIPMLRLNHGTYYPVLAIQDGTEFLYRWPASPMEVGSSPAPLFWGIVTLDYHWEKDASEPDESEGSVSASLQHRE